MFPPYSAHIQKSSSYLQFICAGIIHLLSSESHQLKSIKYTVSVCDTRRAWQMFESVKGYFCFCTAALIESEDNEWDREEGEEPNRQTWRERKLMIPTIYCLLCALGEKKEWQVKIQRKPKRNHDHKYKVVNSFIKWQLLAASDRARNFTLSLLYSYAPLLE